MHAALISKLAAAGAGSLLLLGAGAGLASGETQHEATARALAECEDTFLCVWDGPNYTGNRVDLFECQAGPIPLELRLGSFMNRQTPGTVANFHGAGGEWQYSSTAVEDSPNDKGFDTYLVDPC
ncbi:hypothetical protein E1202_15005 [Saccharopolyspora karakumensis]|uniref:Peptidase inhibitor family I36 n=1 Tax=Saccharopolyspora karakumensis TaxID=2530386 RepID=A0A4R5BV44_9PSEU|nr:peptidase inhibitor family I36 protein [Saccharopolyspora karakumensis]TDD88094.1 hypothetical protein E1202_15005 [Saccharopolyspora karakumensis]